MKTLKDRLRNKELTIGSWITIGHTSVAEIMAKAGFDWLLIDMEHSAITLPQAQNLIRVIELSGVTPLVRVGENNEALIKRVMDAGASGVVVPMVNTLEEAEKAVNAVKYPPKGKRGVGLARAQGYGFEFEEYKEWVNKESIVIIQVEHIESVNNLEDILSIDDIDGFIVGPYDLSASMGRPGEFNNPQLIDIQEKILQIAKNYRAVAGFHVTVPDPAEATKKIREGYKFIGFSLDTLFMGTNSRKGLAEIRKNTK